jgi:hypothetical protein
MYLIKYFALKTSGGAYLFLTTLAHAVFMIFFNIVMYFVYHIEHPFFESHKVNDRPWPWNEDQKKWKELLKISILSVATNGLIVLPLSTIL